MITQPKKPRVEQPTKGYLRGKSQTSLHAQGLAHLEAAKDKAKEGSLLLKAGTKNPANKKS